MKTNVYLLSSFFVAIFLLSLPEVYAQTLNNGKRIFKNFSMEFAAKPANLKTYIPEKPANFRGTTGYGNNIWSNELYAFDTENPLLMNVIADVNIQTTSGDFDPADDNHMYVIDINANTLVKMEIATGDAVSTLALPVPVTGGIWTVLSIHKSTGTFYGVASNGSQSNVYEINQETGETSLVFDTGLSVIMSGTLDNSGNFWLFEIETDNVYKLNMASLNFELVGAAGFDGDSPQGMGYDAIADNVYLAAYEKNVGPQLRLLNRTTGEAGYIGDLPGETTAFGFPGSPAPIFHAIEIPAGWSGISSYINPVNTNISDIFNEITDNLVLIKNNADAFFYPEGNINTLQNWISSEGYIINLSQPSTLTIAGVPVENPTLTFDSGWNILAVIVPEAYPVDALFENTEGFVMAKEIAGTGVYWPEQQINTIGNLLPGKAYHIYCSQEISVTF